MLGEVVRVEPDIDKKEARSVLCETVSDTKTQNETQKQKLFSPRIELPFSIISDVLLL